VTRSYERITAPLPDTIDARIFEVIHFRAADVQAVGLGKKVARWLERNYFQPVG
jgi:hypothetical protein